MSLSITYFLSSELVIGPVAVGIRSSLSFGGIHLLLGNDLAGAKVVVNPLVCDKPLIDQPLILLSRNFLTCFRPVQLRVLWLRH